MKNKVSDHPEAFLLRPGENTSLLSCESSANLTFSFFFLKKTKMLVNYSIKNTVLKFSGWNVA